MNLWPVEHFFPTLLFGQISSDPANPEIHFIIKLNPCQLKLNSNSTQTQLIIAADDSNIQLY